MAGFVVAPNTSVSLPPDWAVQAELLAKVGSQVTVTGMLTPAASGMQTMDAQTMSIAGKNLSMMQASQPVPYAGSGAIRSSSRRSSAQARPRISTMQLRLSRSN